MSNAHIKPHVTPELPATKEQLAEQLIISRYHAQVRKNEVARLRASLMTDLFLLSEPKGAA